MQFDTDPQNGAAYVTFTNVPEAGTANVSTFQLAFFSSGIVEYRYQACAVGDHIALTGWSPGGGGRDPGPVDLSTAVPIQTGTDASPLQLTAAGRPILGTGVVMTASNVPGHRSSIQRRSRGMSSTGCPIHDSST